MPLARRAHGRTAVVAAAIALGATLAACGAASQSPPAGASSEPTDAPLATVSADPALAAAIGPWRRVPFPVEASFGAAYMAACQAANPAIGAAPVVVVDVRGRGWITVLFASVKAAFLCRTTVDDPKHPIEIRPVAVPAGQVTGTAIDLALWTTVRVGPEAITYAVGRVGPDPFAVIGGFVDQSFVFATNSNGWWVAWWPPMVASDGFSAVNHSHVVLTSVEPPPGGEFPVPSPGTSP